MNNKLKIFEVLKTLFPENAHVQIVMSQDEGSLNELYDGERALMEHAIEKRQRSFAMGRICAKEALGNLGIKEFPILMDAKRAPIWPAGISGSISHANGCCAAVVARVQVGEALGLDIEEVSRIEESIWDYAFGLEEIEWLNQNLAEAQKWASVIFAAKETFYKAQYQLTNSWLGFKDVVISVDRTSGEFSVKLLVYLDNWKKEQVFKGRYDFFGGYVACGILIFE